MGERMKFTTTPIQQQEAAMSDAPETIWARPDPYEPDWTGDKTLRSKAHVEYRRADLPPTTAQIMADLRVKALVDAAARFADSFDAYENAAVDHMDFQADCFEALFKTRAALAQLKEHKP